MANNQDGNERTIGERTPDPLLETLAEQEPTLGPAPDATAPHALGASGQPTIPLTHRDAIPDPEVTLDPGTPSPRPLRAPTIDGYEILGELGRGGMGVVYLARQTRLDRPCALKMILAGAHADAATLTRFLDEAAIVARIKHPNIVQIHALGETDGLPYFELEYMAGGSLDQRLDGTPRPARTAAALIEPVARAVAEAHRLGIVHRDLKPGNILIDADGTPKVADFGLAKSYTADSRLTGTEAVLGSPSYMAPEQAEGHTREAGPLADVYSLGAIFYELLTGRPPFKGSSVLQTLEQVRQAEPVPAARLVPGLPRDVDTIALKCLQKSPDRRYASAEALADDLRRFLEDKPIDARPIGLGERAFKYARRRPALAALFALVHLLLAALLGLGVWSYVRIKDSLAETKVARDQAEALATRESSTRAAAELVSAGLAFDRGRALADRGEVDKGLVWMDRAIQLAPSDEPGTQSRNVIAAAQHAWLRPLIKTRWILSSISPRLLALHPDGRTVATGQSDGSIHLWNLTDGRSLTSTKPNNQDIMTLEYTRDGRLLTFGYGASAATIREGTSLKPLTSVGPVGSAQGSYRRAAFDVDARVIAFTDDEKDIVGLRRLDEKPAALVVKHNTVRCSAVSEDGRRVVTGAVDGTILVSDAHTATPIAPPLSNLSGIRDIAVSPNGKFAAAVSGDTIEDPSRNRRRQGLLVLIALEDGAMLARSEWVPEGNFKVAISPDSTLVAVGSWTGVLRVYDASTATLRSSAVGPSSQVTALNFSPDGRFLAVGHSDGDLRLHDLANGQRVGSSVSCKAEVADMEFTGDGRSLLVVSKDSTLRCLDLDALLPANRILDGVREAQTAEFSPDGQRVLSASFELNARIHDSRTGQQVRSPFEHGDRVYAARFSPDGRTLATGGSSKLVRLWDAETGLAIGPSMQNPHWVLNVLFSPDGSRLLAGSSQGGARLWDPRSGKPVGLPVFHPKSAECEVWHLAFTPDGKLAITAATPTSGFVASVVIWDASTGEVLGDALPFEGSIEQIAVIPGARDWPYQLLLINKGQVRRFDLESRAEIGQPFGSGVRCFALSSDGRRLLTGGRDRTVRQWDVHTGEPAGPALDHRESVCGVAWSPDSKLILTGTFEGTIQFWDPHTGQPIGPEFKHQSTLNFRRADDRQPVVFAPDGLTALSVGDRVNLWPVPLAPAASSPLSSEAIQAFAGLRLADGGVATSLDPELWNEKLAKSLPDQDQTKLDPGQWSQRMALSCEAEGQYHAALWHLDRLIETTPSEWTLHARRATLLDALGESAQANAAFKSAMGLAPPGEIDLLRKVRLSKNLETAWSTHDWTGAVSLIQELIQLDPPDLGLTQRLVLAQALAGHLEAARSNLATIVLTQEHTLSDRLALSQLQVATGDRAGYERNCREIESKVKRSLLLPDQVLNDVGWMFSLGPNPLDRLDYVIKRFDRMLRVKHHGAAQSLYINTYGGLLLRAGRPGQAVEVLKGSLLEGGGLPQDWALLAIAHQELGQHEEAERWISRFDDYRPSIDPDKVWDNIEIEALRREAIIAVRFNPVFPANPFATALDP